ncbi:universal stress protein [Nodularia harveyana UHCC-0300]|uniref:Universal stress protein n=1 Tax=Nodularia harveyana UHCC-0300 TaxID=2974287 RepID=A0ABU5UC15_9CYAN|nr:universal stress protein [Nodularia harveyana]MEA5581067.1 universal stress protein [Nodularia harveyana UHCC-0300]
MFDKVLICTDFSDGLHRLSQFIPSLKLAGIKEIVFLHVVPFWEKGIIPQVDTEKVAAAKTQLAAAISETASDVKVTIEVESGKPVDTILKVAQTHESRLIILGSQSRSSLTEKLVGSTMADLSRQTEIPLLVLRPQLFSAYTAEELTLRCQHLFRSLLIPYNDSKASNYVVKQVKQLAENQSDKYLQDCQLCWVLEDIDNPRSPRRILPEQAEEKLSQIKAELESVNVQVQTEILEGNPITQILETGVMTNISAIAVSSGTIGKLQEWLVSSCGAEILRQSWYPVLFFPFAD